MSGGIYFIQDDGKLAKLEERPYDSEALLQELLAHYPDLLAGDQINNDAPRRWLLIEREMAIPIEEGGVDNFAVDHLFLDQDAIPTLVEVKRSTDTRLRREVVGQMLDYAANAVAYWPADELVKMFERRCQSEGAAPEDVLARALGNDMDYQVFWGQVKTNLLAKKIRLLFVADLIPPELRRVIEFLNETMDPVEVLAIEIRQYVGQHHKALVPRVIGQTADAQRKKRVGQERGPKTDRDKFLTQWDDRSRAIYSRLLDFATQNRLRINWGEKGFSLNVVLGEQNVGFVTGWPPSSWNGDIFGVYPPIQAKVHEPEAILSEYRSKMEGIGAVPSGTTQIRLPVAALSTEKEDLFFRILGEVVAMIREHGLASE